MATIATVDLKSFHELYHYGLIGIDNSTLDKYFKSNKILRSHAILHDAFGFLFEHSEKVPGYS